MPFSSSGNAQRPNSQPSNRDLVTLDRLTVQPDRIEAHVRVAESVSPFTSSKLIEAALREFPTIAHHSCRNSKGPTFAAVMDHTPLAHLIEHIVIDLQTHEYARQPSGKIRDDQVVFTGTTQQSADDHRVFIVRVSFLDDLIGLASFKKALHFINIELAQLSIYES